MASIHFKGRVIPPAVTLTHEPFAVEWRDDELQLTLTYAIKIFHSTIDVRIDAPSAFNPQELVDDCGYFYIRALDLARAAVDLLAFGTGYGLSVSLDTFVKPDGGSEPLFLRDPNLPALCTAIRVNSHSEEDRRQLSRVLQLVVGSPPLFMALNDLIGGISLPHVGPINHARAVETLAKLMVPPNTPTAITWKKMQENLRVNEGFLKFITEHSKNPRHGYRVRVPANILSEISRRAWIIMNRYIEFLKRGGNQPLPPSEFSLLSE